MPLIHKVEPTRKIKLQLAALVGSQSGTLTLAISISSRVGGGGRKGGREESIGTKSLTRVDTKSKNSGWLTYH